MLLRKGVYSYEYMDNCERFDETSLPDKKAFYSELCQEDITDKDITDITDDITITKDITDAHAQNVFKKLKLKTLVIIMTCMFKVIHYCLLMYLETLETNVLKYLKLILLIFCLHQD